jgi:hypothetical protein
MGCFVWVVLALFVVCAKADLFDDVVSVAAPVVDPVAHWVGNNVVKPASNWASNNVVNPTASWVSKDAVPWVSNTAVPWLGRAGAAIGRNEGQAMRDLATVTSPFSSSPRSKLLALDDLANKGGAIAGAVNTGVGKLVDGGRWLANTGPGRDVMGALRGSLYADPMTSPAMLINNALGGKPEAWLKQGLGYAAKGVGTGNNLLANGYADLSSRFGINKRYSRKAFANGEQTGA